MPRYCSECGKEAEENNLDHVRLDGIDTILCLACQTKLSESQKIKMEVKGTQLLAVFDSPEAEYKLINCLEVFIKYGYTVNLTLKNGPPSGRFYFEAWHQRDGYFRDYQKRILIEAGSDSLDVEWKINPVYIKKIIIQNGKTTTTKETSQWCLTNEEAVNYVMWLKNKYEKKEKKFKKDKLRLTIELVPAPLWHRSICWMLDNHWGYLRNQVFREHGTKCEICRSSNKPLHVHEKWEYDDKRNIQKLSGFEVLCQLCHGVKHLGYSKRVLPMRGEKQNRYCQSYDKVVSHFCEINNCTVEEFEFYRHLAFEEWEKRSKTEWTQDFGLIRLSKYFPASAKEICEKCGSKVPDEEGYIIEESEYVPSWMAPQGENLFERLLCNNCGKHILENLSSNQYPVKSIEQRFRNEFNKKIKENSDYGYTDQDY